MQDFAAHHIRPSVRTGAPSPPGEGLGTVNVRGSIHNLCPGRMPGSLPIFSRIFALWPCRLLYGAGLCWCPGLSGPAGKAGGYIGEVFGIDPYVP